MEKSSKKKVFSSYKGPVFPEPNFLKIQLDSFKWFTETGLKELFDEISPIKDYTGHELEIHFLDYKFDEPKYNEEQAKEKKVPHSPIQIERRVPQDFPTQARMTREKKRMTRLPPLPYEDLPS